MVIIQVYCILYNDPDLSQPLARMILFTYNDPGSLGRQQILFKIYQMGPYRPNDAKALPQPLHYPTNMQQQHHFLAVLTHAPISCFIAAAWSLDLPQQNIAERSYQNVISTLQFIEPHYQWPHKQHQPYVILLSPSRAIYQQHLDYRTAAWVQGWFCPLNVPSCCLHHNNYMNIVVHLCLVVILALLPPARAASTPWSQKFNRDFITGQYIITFGNTASIFSTMYYVNPYAHFIAHRSAVYYTTKSVRVDLSSNNYPNNPSYKNIEYYIGAQVVTQTYLNTSLTGFLYIPQFYSFTFNYLIVLTSNRIFGTHVVLANIQFYPSVSSVQTQLPTAYNAGHSVSYYTMLRDLVVRYPTSSQFTADHQFHFGCSNSLVNNTLVSQLSVSFFFQVYLFRFLVVVVDQTTLPPKYLSYTLQVSAAYSSSFSPGIDLNNSLNTFLGGLSYLGFYADRGNNFYCEYVVVNSMNFNYICYSPQSTFSYSYWATSYFDCDGAQWILNSTSGTCSDACLSGQYYDYNNDTCQTCPPTCLTCYDETRCESCNATNFRILSNLSCLPVSGYYESGTAVAAPCDTTCLTCAISSTNCTSCSKLTLLVGGACKPCGQIWEGCQQCSEGGCLSCASPYHQVNSSYCNLACQDSHCQVCSNSNTSFCYSCLPNPYRLLNGNGQCIPICGDGVLIDLEQCDDGNMNSHDGCSSQCKFQQGYTCTTLASIQGYNYTAYCSYHLPINFSLLTQEKLQTSNSLRFVLAIDSYQESFWKLFSSLDPYIYLSVKHSNLQARFISSWEFSNRLLLSTSELRLLSKSDLPPNLQNYLTQQLLQVVFQYQQELQNQPLTMSFAFNRSRDPRVSSIPSFTQTYTVLPSNNYYAHLYKPQSYQHQKIITTLLKLQAIVLCLCYVVSMFCTCKRIIAQAIMVAQIAYAGLVTIEWGSPLHSAVKSLSILFNPWNVLYSDQYRPFDDPLLPDRLKGMGLYSNLLENFNSGALFVLLPLVVGMVMKLVQCAKCLSQQQKEKLSQYSKVCLTEFVFAGLTVIGCAFGCSLVMQVKYGMTDLGYSGMGGLVIGGVVSLLFAVYLILWLVRSSFFQEYYNILSMKNALEIMFSLVYSYSGLFISIAYFSLFSYKYITVITVGYACFLLILLAFYPVYTKTRDKIRVQINLMTIVFTQSAYVVDVIWSDYSYQQSSSLLLMGGMVIPIALGLNLVVNCSFLVYQIVKMLNEWLKERAKKKMEKQQKQYLSEKSEEIKKMHQGNQLNPLNFKNQVKFRTPLLYDSLEPKDTSNNILKQELDKFLQVQKLQAQKVLKILSAVPTKSYRTNSPKQFEMQLRQRNELLDAQFEEIPGMRVTKLAKLPLKFNLLEK